MYIQAQGKILNLLKDYSAAKEGFLKNEKEISDHYVMTLQKATESFSDLEQGLKDQIGVFIASLSSYVENFKTSIEKIIPQNLSDELAEKYSGFHQDYLNRLKVGIQDFQSSMKISSGILEKAEEEYVNTLKKSAETINSTCLEYSSSVGLFSVDIEDSAKKIRDRFGEISESLGDYIEKTNKIKENLEELTDSFQTQVETFDAS